MAPQRINFHLNLPPSVIGNPFLVGVIADFAWEGSFWWEHQQNLVSGAAVTLFQSAADDLMTQPNENILSLYPHLPPSPITPNPPPNRSHFRHSSTGSCTVHTGHKDMQTKSFPLPLPPRLTANKMQNRILGRSALNGRPNMDDTWRSDTYM